ncbi:MAG: hypothetical protein KGJ57_04875 [Sphingomonadales bacterium]|nr:hypothetical protein [Sphingomonadales bacterium]MDE2168749.1 hypothetical protein [Sphingomonadales bacterium]
MPAADPAALARWRAVRSSADLQFTPPVPWHPAPPPSWLAALGRWLEHVFLPLARLFGKSWPWVEKGLIGLGIAALLWLGWIILLPYLRRRAVAVPEEETGWTPPAGEAAILLRDAEALAAAGDYDGATHLLLRRSVAQLAAAQVGLVHPASTAREIATMDALPPPARSAFATMAGRVEASRFALHALSQADWLAARDAYAAFARLPLSGVQG